MKTQTLPVRLRSPLPQEAINETAESERQKVRTMDRSGAKSRNGHCGVVAASAGRSSTSEQAGDATVTTFNVQSDWAVLVLEDTPERIAWFKERLPRAV